MSSALWAMAAARRRALRGDRLDGFQEAPKSSVGKVEWTRGQRQEAKLEMEALTRG